MITEPIFIDLPEGVHKHPVKMPPTNPLLATKSKSH